MAAAPGAPGVHPEARAPGAYVRSRSLRSATAIVQAAVKVVIEPIFEADFASARSGFGPGARRTTRSRCC